MVFPIRMDVCVPMLHTLCFIGSMVPVVCSTSHPWPREIKTLLSMPVCNSEP